MLLVIIQMIYSSRLRKADRVNSVHSITNDLFTPQNNNLDGGLLYNLAKLSCELYSPEEVKEHSHEAAPSGAHASCFRIFRDMTMLDFRT